MIHVGGDHAYHWSVQYCEGTQTSKDDIPHGTEHPHGTRDIPSTFIMISPNGTEHLPVDSVF